MNCYHVNLTAFLIFKLLLSRITNPEVVQREKIF